MTHSKHFIHAKRFAATGALLIGFLIAGIHTSEAQILPRGKKTHSTRKKRHSRIKYPAKIDGYIVLSSYYDDNVFNYSDADIKTFQSSPTPLKRFPINQIDDIVTSVAARGDIVWSRTKRSYWRLRLRYDASLYQYNTFRNNNQFGVELRRKKRHSYTQLSVLWMPNYYLRHLYWSRTSASTLRTGTNPSYVAADLARAGIYVTHEQRLGRRLYGRLKVGYTLRNYGAPFDERDNNRLSVATRLRKIFSRRVEAYIGASAALSNSSATDYNVVGIADISNSEIGIRGGFEIKLDKRGKLYWTESVAYAHQSFNSSDTADVYHYNRSDNEIIWTNRLTWRAHPHWQPRLFYTLRNSTSDVLPGVSDAGAYASNRFGMQIVHYF